MRRSLGLLFGGSLLVAATASWVRFGASGSIVAPAMASSPPAPTSSNVRADGRVVTAAGGRVTVGAETTGTIERVLVSEGSVVKAGDPLVVFRAGEQRALAGEAWAQSREAEASVRFLTAELKRTRALVTAGALPQQALDKIMQERDAARARKAAALSGAQRFANAVARTTLVAPIAGTVIVRSAEPGETVMIGTPLIVVADLARLRVEAEVDELDALRVSRGMRASVSIEGAEGRAVAGHVDEIAAAVAPRGLRPQDPARPTDTQVLKVKIELAASDLSLKLGQRVSVSLESPEHR